MKHTTKELRLLLAQELRHSRRLARQVEEHRARRLDVERELDQVCRDFVARPVFISRPVIVVDPPAKPMPPREVIKRIYVPGPERVVERIVEKPVEAERIFERVVEKPVEVVRTEYVRQIAGFFGRLGDRLDAWIKR